MSLSITFDENAFEIIGGTSDDFLDVTYVVEGQVVEMRSKVETGITNTFFDYDSVANIESVSGSYDSFSMSVPFSATSQSPNVSTFKLDSNNTLIPIFTNGDYSNISSISCPLLIEFPSGVQVQRTMQINNIAASPHVQKHVQTESNSTKLVDHLYEQVLSRIENLSVVDATTTHYIQSYDQSDIHDVNDPLTHDAPDIHNPQIVLEPNRWCSDLDFSFTALMSKDTLTHGHNTPNNGTIYGTLWVQNHGCTLITSRHAYGANHFHPKVGAEVCFRRTDGTYAYAFVDAEERIFLDDGSATDAVILHLDREITGITPATMMPPDWEAKYCPAIKEENQDLLDNSNPFKGGYPCVGLAIHPVGGFVTGEPKSTCIIQWVTGTTNDDTVINGLTNESIKDSRFDGLTNGVIGGDSGCSFFFIINDKPVLLACYATGGVDAGSHPLTSALMSKIQTALDNTSDTTGVYSITYADLSMFKDFTNA